MDSDAIYQHLFTRLPSERFYSTTLAFEVTRFCRDNLPLFDPHLLGLLKLSFPNLFKVRVVVLWDSGRGGMQGVWGGAGVSVGVAGTLPNLGLVSAVFV